MAIGMKFLPMLYLVSLSRSTPNFKVDILHKPDICNRESNYGDQMFVHFVGRKLDSGEVFDQR